jgi:phenylalanyl-tRNA synthetase beta chain
MLAWMGILRRSIANQLKLDALVSLGELDLDLMLGYARSVPQLMAVVPFPVVQRDLNFIVDETLFWQDLSHTIYQAAGPLCIGVDFREIYRDPKRDGDGKKRILLSLQLQSATETLTSQQADEVIQKVLKACQDRHRASILT